MTLALQVPCSSVLVQNVCSTQQLVLSLSACLMCSVMLFSCRLCTRAVWRHISLTHSVLPGLGKCGLAKEMDCTEKQPRTIMSHHNHII